MEPPIILCRGRPISNTPRADRHIIAGVEMHIMKGAVIPIVAPFPADVAGDGPLNDRPGPDGVGMVFEVWQE